MSDQNEQVAKELEERINREDPPPKPPTTAELQERARRAAESS